MIFHIDHNRRHNYQLIFKLGLLFLDHFIHCQDNLTREVTVFSVIFCGTDYMY